MTLAVSPHTSQGLPTAEIELWKRAWWEEIGYDAHPGQVRLHELVRTHECVEANLARQWGKTTWAAKGEAFPEWVRWKDTVAEAWEWPRQVLVIAPYLDQADIIFMECHRMAHERGVPLERDRSSGKLDLMTREGSRLRCVSGQNPAALRGPQWHLVIIDEGAYLKGLKQLVDEVIMPTLIARHGKLVIVGSPDAPGSDMHEFALLGDDPAIPEWGHMTGPSTDNWHVPGMAAFIESQRRRGVPEDVIEREYMGRFRPRHGLVYDKATDRVMAEADIRRLTPLIMEHGRWHRAIDWGFVNPFANITHAQIGEMLVAWDECYVQYETPDKLAPRLARDDQMYDFELNVADLERPDNIDFMAAYTYQGPKGEARLKGAWIKRGTKPPIVERIDNLRTLMGTGRYWIHPRCRNYIRELGMEKYRDPKGALNVGEKPVDAHNHGSSASGYLAWHLFGRQRGAAPPFGAGAELDSEEVLEGYVV